MASFDDVRLPEEIEKGSQGGPGFQTTVITLGTGFEQRNSNWSQQRCKYDISYGIMNREDYFEVLNFFMARQGRSRGFRFKDWSDYQATGQVLGTGGGSPLVTTFQLRKQYISGPITYNRKITRPVNGTVKIYKNGVLSISGYSVNYDTGLVTFSPAPGAGVVITADFEFDVPVRFDVDEIKVTLEWSEAGSIESMDVVEIKE